MDKFTPQDLQQAVEDLSMLEYFPREPGAQAAIMRLLVQMVPHRKALRLSLIHISDPTRPY